MVFQGHHADMVKSARQRALKKVFHFDCCCTACADDYPLAANLPNTYSASQSCYSKDDQTMTISEAEKQV